MKSKHTNGELLELYEWLACNGIYKPTMENTYTLDEMLTVLKSKKDINTELLDACKVTLGMICAFNALAAKSEEEKYFKNTILGLKKAIAKAEQE